MSEQDLRDGLRDAVRHEPPLSFDPDALIADAEHRITRRRAMVGAAILTAVLGLAAVGVPAALRDNGVVTAPAAPSATEFSWPPAHPAKPRQRTGDELRAQAVRMRAHTDEVFGHVVARARGIRTDPFGGEAADVYELGQKSLEAGVHFTVDGTASLVDVSVQVEGAAQAPAEICARQECRFTVRPDGSALLTYREKVDELEILSVVHYRTDGVSVSAAAYNADTFGVAAPVYGPAVSATEAELTALALDPAYTF